MKIAVAGVSFEQSCVVLSSLESAGHACIEYASAAQLLRCAELQLFHFYIVGLDCARPELTRKLRNIVGVAKPMLLIAAQGANEEHFHTGLLDGADHVLRASFQGSELAARVDSIARRAYPNQDYENSVVQVHDYKIDLRLRVATHRGKNVGLTCREFEVASYLFRRLGHLVSRSALEKSIWGRSLDGNSRTLDTHVYRVRMKMRLRPENGLVLNAAYGQGFQLTSLLINPDA